MGLDWNPGPKMKPGQEGEFQNLRKALQSGWCFRRQSKERRLADISQSAFVTLGAPQVGLDDRANEWAKQRFPDRVNKALSWEQFFSNLQGFYVLSLVPPCDGLPRYTNGSPGGYVEAYSFRAKFLEDCVEIIGDALLDSAWVSKVPETTVSYGEDLLRRASGFAAANSVDPEGIHLDEDCDSVQFKLDVVFGAGRWCQFWGERGHWLEAYY